MEKFINYTSRATFFFAKNSFVVEERKEKSKTLRKLQKKK